MDILFKYLIQSSVSIIIFYVVYHLFLKRDTFFAVNRIYLIGSIIVSLIIPLFNITINLPSQEFSYVIWLDTITITANEIQETVAGNLNIFQVLAVVYLTGVVLFLARFVFQLFQLIKLIYYHGISKKAGMKFVFVDKPLSPFSFFNLVFINPKDLKGQQSRIILAHEQVHVKQGHTFDLILVELLTIVLWFNPVIWFYRSSLKVLHEYLADEGVISCGINSYSYQNILLTSTLGVQINDLTNNFSKSLLKRRIIMMTKTKSNRTAKLKVFLAFPVLMAIALVFSLSVNSYVYSQTEKTTEKQAVSATKSDKDLPPPPPKAEKGDEPIKVVQEEGKPAKILVDEQQVFKVVKEMPSYKGGHEAFIKYLVENIKYPDDAKQKGISGTVFVQFIVAKDGHVSTARILRGVYPSLDEEALRVVSAMPAWNPGKDEDGKPVNVEYNIPIKFNLDSDKTKEADTEQI